MSPAVMDWPKWVPLAAGTIQIWPVPMNRFPWLSAATDSGNSGVLSAGAPEVGVPVTPSPATA